MYSNSVRELLSELTGGAAVFERGHMDVKKKKKSLMVCLIPLWEKKIP